jgi:hypothetical protein
VSLDDLIEGTRLAHFPNSNSLFAGVYGYIATLIGLETWAYTGGPAESGYGWSFSPLYSLLLCLWGIAVSEGWRIKQRKLSVAYGTYRISNVSRLRSQYLASLPGNDGFDAPATTANHALHDSHSVRGDPTFLAREGKIVVGVLVVFGLGLGLAGLLSGIFLFEAFLSKLYDGPGKQVLVIRTQSDLECERTLTLNDESSLSGPDSYPHVRGRRAKRLGVLPLDLGQAHQLGEPSYQVEPP